MKVYIDITKIDMEKLYSILNKRYFNNSLPLIDFGLCRTRNTYGRVWYDRDKNVSKLEMSKIHRFDKYSFMCVFLHEMIHVYLLSNHKITGHGKDFKDMCYKINEKTNGKYKAYDIFSDRANGYDAKLNKVRSGYVRLAIDNKGRERLYIVNKKYYTNHLTRDEQNEFTLLKSADLGGLTIFTNEDRFYFFNDNWKETKPELYEVLKGL